jgi:cytochrome oxidase Cu insertion factor (SCO1/SenC/PrrC family)
MKVTIKFWLVIIVVFSLSGLFSCLSSEEAPKEEKWDIKQQSIEKKGLDFTVVDLNGNTVKLSDFNINFLIRFFWIKMVRLHQCMA